MEAAAAQVVCSLSVLGAGRFPAQLDPPGSLREQGWTMWPPQVPLGVK